MRQFRLLNPRTRPAQQRTELGESFALADRRFEKNGRLMLEVLKHNRVRTLVFQAFCTDQLKGEVPLFCGNVGEMGRDKFS